jgi:hypothetical protein
MVSRIAILIEHVTEEAREQDKPTHGVGRGHRCCRAISACTTA